MWVREAQSPESVGLQILSLRQLSFANPLQPCVSAQISFCFKGVCRKRPNLRDWQDGDFRSLNGFRLFPSEPRRIWFGQRKRNVSSRLPIRVDRTFHRSSAARHSIRDTRSGRGAVRRCARLRMRQPEWPDRKGLQNRLFRHRARTARRPLRESHVDLLSEAPPATLLFVGEVQFLPHPGQVVWRLAICRGPAVFGVLQPLQPFDHLRTPTFGLCRLTR